MGVVELTDVANFEMDNHWVYNHMKQVGDFAIITSTKVSKLQIHKIPSVTYYPKTVHK